MCWESTVTHHQKNKKSAPSLFPAKLFNTLTFYPLVAKYPTFDDLNILLFYMLQTTFSKQGEYKSNKIHHIYRRTL